MNPKIKTYGIYAFLIVALLFGITYGVSSYENWQTKQEIEEYQEGFYEKVEAGEIIASDEAAKAYFSLTQEEIDSLTRQELKVELIKEAATFAVFDLEMSFTTDLDGTLQKSKIKSFQFNDNFSDFVVNPKWERYYEALSLFGSNKYEYTYFSNVYAGSNKLFPIQYYEDHKATVSYDDNFGSLISDVIFNDRVQIVLPDKDQNQRADDVELTYVFSIEPTKNGVRLPTQLCEIPMEVANGVLRQDGSANCKEA